MESMCKLGGARVNIAVLELQRDVAPDVRVLLVRKSILAVGAPLPEVGDGLHEAALEEHGVWVLQKPNMRFCNADDVERGWRDAVCAGQISQSVSRGGRVRRARR